MTSSGGRAAASYRSRMLDPWRIRDFRWFWAGSATQAVSQGMQFLVLGWLVLDVTESNTQLGLVLFFYGIPNIGLLPVGGVLADRLDRKLLLIVTQGAVGVLIAVLAALTSAELVALWHVYLVAVLLGVLQALNQPARVTFISDMVGDRTLLDAVAHFNASVHVGRIIGPPLVGAVIDQWGLGVALFLNSSFYGASVLCLSRIGRQPRRPSLEQPSLLRNFVDGLVQIRNAPVLLTVIVLTCSFGGFGMSHLQIIPAFAKDQLGADATAAGLLLLASAIGSLIGNISLTFIGRTRLYRWYLACLLLFCITLVAFGWSQWFWVSWALFLIAGVFSLGSVWPLATTILQLSSPAEVRGRVMGVLHFTPGFHYLGALPLAAASGLVGWPVAMSTAAGLCLLVTVWFGIGRKAGRQLAAQPD